ncbi:hypothetical protein NL676_000872 [Syzygium grande]|nr:hypothetical protein NL676_000872 [Syzygium grande]
MQRGVSPAIPHLHEIPPHLTLADTRCSPDEDSGRRGPSGPGGQVKRSVSPAIFPGYEVVGEVVDNGSHDLVSLEARGDMEQ